MKQQTVTVRDEVNSATALAASGNKHSAYSSAAGGATNTGKASAEYKIQLNG